MTQKKTYKSKWINIRGKAKWAKVYEPDEAFNSSKYKINIYPLNEAEWKKFHDAGIQKKVQEDADGKYFVTDRNALRLFGSKVVMFCPPKISIRNADGKYDDLVYYRNAATGEVVKQYAPEDKDKIERVGTPVLIGNGSEVVVNINVYNTMKGPGQRLESVTIIDLIDYTPSDKEEEPETEDDTNPEEDESDGKAPW